MPAAWTSSAHDSDPGSPAVWERYGAPPLDAAAPAQLGIS